MSATFTVDEAQARLRQLILQMAPGEEIVITENQQPVAKLVGERAKRRKARTPGNCKGMITLLIEDDEHLEGFADYMP